MKNFTLLRFIENEFDFQVFDRTPNLVATHLFGCSAQEHPIT